MKTICLTIILFLNTSAFGFREVANCVPNLTESTGTGWQGQGAVSVYFVRNVFTPDEQQRLWGAIESWAQKAKKSGREISFVAAGETSGLIDCLGCLTIARHTTASHATRKRVSFNSLRQDNNGKLISAWIGFEYEGNNVADLPGLMLQALERGLVSSPSKTTRDEHR